MITPQILVSTIGMGIGIGIAAAYQKKHQSLQREKRIHFVKRENLESELDDLNIETPSSEACDVCGDELLPEEIAEVVATEEGYKVVCEKDTCINSYSLS